MLECNYEFDNGGFLVPICLPNLADCLKDIIIAPAGNRTLASNLTGIYVVILDCIDAKLGSQPNQFQVQNIDYLQ